VFSRAMAADPQSAARRKVQRPMRRIMNALRHKP
jgi:hypothetical protein